MNFKLILEEFDGDKEWLTEATAQFLKSVRGQLGALRRAISDGDAAGSTAFRFEHFGSRSRLLRLFWD